MFKKWIGGAKKGHGFAPEAIIAVVKAADNANNAVIANTSTIPEKRAEYTQKLVDAGVIDSPFTIAPAPVNIKSEEPAVETKTETLDAVTSTEAGSEVAANLSPALAKLDIHPIICGYLANNGIEIAKFMDILTKANSNDDSIKSEAVKQLINLNIDSINEVLVREIIKSKNINLIKEIVDIGNHNFNVNMVEHLKANCSNNNEDHFSKVVFSYLEHHNNGFAKLSTVISKFHNATNKDYSEFIAQAIKEESDLIGAVVDYFNPDLSLAGAVNDITQ